MFIYHLDSNWHIIFFISNYLRFENLKYMNFISNFPIKYFKNSTKKPSLKLRFNNKVFLQNWNFRLEKKIEIKIKIEGKNLG